MAISVKPRWAIIDTYGQAMEKYDRSTPVDEVALEARKYASDVSIHDVPKEVLGESQANPIEPEKLPPLALQSAALREFSEAEVMRYTPAEALEEILYLWPRSRPTRKGERVVSYKLADFVDRLLNVNYKTRKRIPGAPMYVVGLSAFPERKPLDYARTRGLPIVLPDEFKTFCAASTPECRAACLVFSGQNQVEQYNNQRKMAISASLLNHSPAFLRLLEASVARNARSKGKPFIRLNVYSDIPWELVVPWMFAKYKDVQFYDYTKVPGRKTPSNYDLTFSFAGTYTSFTHVEHELGRGRRAAVVFLRSPGRGTPGEKGYSPRESLPKTFLGLPVVDGDDHDMRPVDPGRVIVGLHYKPPKRSDIAAAAFTEGAAPVENKAFVVPCLEIDGELVAAAAERQTGVAHPDAAFG